MDVLNKIINQNFDITLSDADLMNIVEFWKIIGDFKQKCFYIRTIIEAINNKIIDPDTFLTVSISNCQSFDDLLLVSIALRYGANPNLYVVMNGVGVVHIMVFTLLYCRGNIPNDLIEYMLLVLSLLGSSYASPATTPVNQTGVPYNQGLVNNTVIFDKNTVGEFLISQGFYDFSSPLSYLETLDLNDRVSLGTLVDNPAIALPMGANPIITVDTIAIDGIIETAPREMPPPCPDLASLILYNAVKTAEFTPIGMSINKGECNELKLTIETGALEIFKILIDRGFKFTYFSMNRILIAYRETVIKVGDSKPIINRVFNLIYFDMIKFIVSKGARMDREQYNIISNFSEETAVQIAELYSRPLWVKACSASDKVPLPEVIRDLAYSMNIDMTGGKMEICNAIADTVRQNPSVLKEAAVTRQRNLVSANVHSAADYAKGKTDVLCRNAGTINGNPFEYNDASLAYYTDESSNVWCFTSSEFENLIVNPVNPHTGKPLPNYLINRMQGSLGIFKSLGISPQRVVPISEAISSINKSDSINNVTTEFVNETIIRLSQTRGIFEDVLRKISLDRMERVLSYINMEQDYLPLLTQSHRFATFCKALYLFFKKNPDSVTEILNMITY